MEREAGTRFDPDILCLITALIGNSPARAL
jgi:hypothetical protein